MQNLERTPLQEVVALWNKPRSVFTNNDVRLIHPELGEALDKLVEWASRVITDPASVHVPPTSPPRPVAGPRPPSGGQSGYRGADTSRTDSRGVTWTTPSIFEDEK